LQKGLGIIAGGGEYPRCIIRHCQLKGYPFCVVALEGQCDAQTPHQTPHLWIPLGAVGRGLKFLREHHVENIIFAGHIQRPSLSDIKPDLLGMRWLAQIAVHAQGDDSLLRALCRQFEKEGFRVVGSKDIFDESFFMPQGVITQHHPNQEDTKDIERGIAILKALGDQDVGQAVIVQQGMVLGIEAIEGTDALIRRCGDLKRAGEGGVLVKLSKRTQDLRVDMPTIGPDTIDQLIAAGLKGIALEAAHVQVIARDEVVRKADEASLFITGISFDEWSKKV